MTTTQTPSPFDTAFSGLAALPFLLLCLGIYLFAFGARRLVETLVPRAATNRYWTELVLPVLPLVIGAGVCLALKSFPYPAGLGAAWGWRVIVGVCCGGLSGFVYRIAKAFLTKAGGGSAGGAGPGGNGEGTDPTTAATGGGDTKSPLP